MKSPNSPIQFKTAGALRPIDAAVAGCRQFKTFLVMLIQ